VLIRRATILAMYSPQLLDHFEHPRNPGEIVNADASAQVENPACGDVLRLTLKIDSDRIVDVKFLAKGCVPAMACGSAITELVKGKSIAEARKLQPGNMVDAVGGLPEASSHASHLAIDALGAALKQIKT
jgi:nitrogen fixation protein NifU and related proteins